MIFKAFLSEIRHSMNTSLGVFSTMNYIIVFQLIKKKIDVSASHKCVTFLTFPVQIFNLIVP